MAIVVRCPYCRKRIKRPDAEAGHTAVCAACGSQFWLPTIVSSGPGMSLAVAMPARGPSTAAPASLAGTFDVLAVGSVQTLSGPSAIAAAAARPAPAGPTVAPPDFVAKVRALERDRKAIAAAQAGAVFPYATQAGPAAEADQALSGPVAPPAASSPAVVHRQAFDHAASIADSVTSAEEAFGASPSAAPAAPSADDSAGWSDQDFVYPDSADAADDYVASSAFLPDSASSSPDASPAIPSPVVAWATPSPAASTTEQNTSPASSAPSTPSHAPGRIAVASPPLASQYVDAASAAGRSSSALWPVLTTVCIVVIAVMGLFSWHIINGATRERDEAQAEKLQLEAQELAAAHQYIPAQKKYQELTEFIASHDAGNPQLQEISAAADAEQQRLARQIQAVETAMRAPAAPRAAPVETPPAPVDASPAASHAATRPSETIAMTPPAVPNPTPAPLPAAAAAPAPSRPPIRPEAESSDALSDERLGKSISHGVDFLLDMFDPATFELKGGPRSRKRRNDADSMHDGADALAVYALMQCEQATGEARLGLKTPFMAGALTAMKNLKMKTHFLTYSRALRATALALNNRPEDNKVLREDIQNLLKIQKLGGYDYENANIEGRWDNSNSQYGLLGVWSGAEAGVEVPMGFWADVEKHWSKSQLPDGQWGYVEGGTDGRLSMTCAGLASLFVAHEYLDAARYAVATNRDPYSPAMKKGLEWLETGDHVAVGTRQAEWWGYTLYGIERVGLASGFKYFGKHEWYPELAADIIGRQNPDGSWGEFPGDVVNTSYALLFLARGRHPVLMNKLRFDGNWASHPRDVANAARYASAQLERPLNWQIASLSNDWTTWTDSPILYLASLTPPKLTDEDVGKIKQFVDSGGMLFVQADGDSLAMASFAADLAKQMFPQYPLKDMPADHPLTSAVFKLDAPLPPLKMVSNEGRILMLFSPTDITRHWQFHAENSVAGKPLYRLAVNLFGYAAGRRDLRNRLQTNVVAAPQSTPSLTIKIARVKYQGNWDPEPYAWKRYANWFARQTGYALDVQPVDMNDLDPAVYPFAHLTGSEKFSFSLTMGAALKKYIEHGGVLLIDPLAGSRDFEDSIRNTLFLSAFGAALPAPLPWGHPLFAAGAPGMTDLSRPVYRAYTHEKSQTGLGQFNTIRLGKGHVLLTSLDITSGLLNTNTWGILGYDPAYAQQFMKNAILWTIDGQHEE